jgi:cytochrome c peroxidase
MASRQVQLEEAFMRTSVPIGASLLFLSITALALAADDQLMKQAQGLFQPVPSEAPAIKGVTATPAMVQLGKDLYFDPRLSQSHNISCNTCHQIGLGGVDMLPVSIGHKWQKGGRNAVIIQKRQTCPKVILPIASRRCELAISEICFGTRRGDRKATDV